jgi:hypothetical protein
MDAVSDGNPDVDSAGVYFVTVEEFERHETSDREPELPADERPVITNDGPLPSTEHRSTSINGPSLRART